MISGAGGGIGGKIYKWKRYELNSKTVYTWDKYSLVTTVTYKWEKWNANNPSYGAWRGPAGNTSFGSSYKAWSSYRYDGSRFYGDGSLIGTLGTAQSNANNSYYPGTENNATHQLCHLGSFISGGVNVSFDNTTIYYANQIEGFTFVSLPSNIISKGSTSYGQVTSTNSGAYPTNGVSGSYWYVSAGSDTSYSRGDTSYGQVESESSSTYPNGDAQDGYWYGNRTSRVEYSMGTYKDTVYSTSRNQYPDNGHNNSYWYVFDGES